MKQYRIQCTSDFQQKLERLLSSIECNAEVVFEPGVYVVDRSIRLTEGHKNIRFTSHGDVTLLGGHRLTQWKPVAGTTDADRFDPSVRDKVVYCDLTEEGMGNLCPFSSRGFGRPMGKAHSELYANGKPLSIAQFPRGNVYTHITGVPSTSPDEWGEQDGLLENGYYWADERLKRWNLKDAEIWVMGYWKYDWANSVEIIDTCDPETGFIKMKPPYGNYGYRVGERIRFYNVIEEVLEPGDYFMDFKQNRVYLYPVEDMSDIVLSTTKDPFFDVDHAEQITIENLNMKISCSMAVNAEYSEKLRINNCNVEYMGACAFNIVEGHDPVVENCTIHGCGDSGIVLVGGNRCTLEPMNAQVYNNHIYNIGRWSRCYHGAVMMAGVGMTARHNLIHDCPHTAIFYGGNEIRIMDNEIYRVVMETADAGAIYAGRDFTYRGNEVSHNYIHHLGSGIGIGSMGIYNDDVLCGTKMCDNYFEELTRAIQLGGGRDFIVKNNVFVKCAPGVHFDSRCADMGSHWENNTRNTLQPNFYKIRRYVALHGFTERCKNMCESSTETVSAMEGEYIRRYPELARLDEFMRNQIGEGKYIPGQARIESNVFMSARKFRYRVDGKARKIYDHGKEVPLTQILLAWINDTRADIKRGIAGSVGEVLTISNMQATKDDFADVDWGDIEVKRSCRTFQHNFMPANFHSIGLKTELRRVNPADVRTRVDFIPGDPVARIGLRNKKDESIAGVLTLGSTDDAELGVKQFDFSLAAGEEKYYEVPVIRSTTESIIEVFSDIPGVRPSRST